MPFAFAYPCYLPEDTPIHIHACNHTEFADLVEGCDHAIRIFAMMLHRTFSGPLAPVMTKM